jgi:error-prone DNA polymerase
VSPDPFVHLRVASGYSLQYGASHPSALVERAVGLGMDVLALTDRDGLYGAVRFAKHCLRTGIRPVVGVDFAVSPVLTAPVSRSRSRTPVRGGAQRDLRLPRAVVLATSRAGWASLCRLTSAIHLAGDRGDPVATLDLVSRHAVDVLVMLGPDSELGRTITAGRPDLAERVLDAWRDAVGASRLLVAATHHELPGTGPGSAAHAGRMIGFADAHGLTGVLTNDVRMATPDLAPTVDVLDAARRLVPLDLRNIDRRNAEGYLKPTDDMAALAAQVADLAGRGPGGAERLLAETRETGLAAALDPRADIGLGEIHLPELGALTGGTAVGAADAVLRARCEAGITARYGARISAVGERMDAELDVIAHLGFAPYFLTVGRVVDMIGGLGIRCAARGSGAGSLVNYLLGISGVDPLAHGLIMERFLSPLRVALPDIDIDVESARRTEVYEAILAEFGGERVACVAMLDTYRVRHAVRDVGAALSLPPAEIDAIAKSFPHIRARDARAALRDLPELRAAGLGERRLDVLFSLVESLDGLPRHVALHPCGVLLSDTTLLDRTPVEASFGGFPMSQFDKDDVEDMGLLKLDVLGIRMQSALAHALGEISRVESETVDIDALAPYDDPATYDLIGKSATLGCFQIESPGQRELLGKFGPTTFDDIVIDISLFRPGPVKSDMVVPFLEARNGWREPVYLHPDLRPILAETGGVVVFHEQIIAIVAVMTGCTLAQGDEARRALGDDSGKEDVRAWFFPAAEARGYAAEVVAKVWDVLESFASFGFCKAHAAAFALPTYQSAWLKTHYPAHFLAGVLTHDPGMYPKRLLLEEARRLGVTILGLDVNAADDTYRVERLRDAPPPREFGGRLMPGAGLPDGRAHGIRLSLADVQGIGAAEISRIVAGRPFHGISDFWRRAKVSQPIVERLVLAGAFDSLYGIGPATDVAVRGRVTRRDLLLAVADLARFDRADTRAARRARGLRRTDPPEPAGDDPRDLARRQTRTTAEPRAPEIQLPLDLWGDESLVPESLGQDDPGPETSGTYAGRHDGRGVERVRDVIVTGLPEMTADERLQAELGILGLDVSQHVVTSYLPLMRDLGVTFSADLLNRRSRKDVLVAGVKVATQTPPVRSGRRVVFLTLDDTTGPVDATFFEDVQGPYAATVFDSWLLVVRGELRRTGPRGVSVRAEGCWDLRKLDDLYRQALSETGDPAAALAAVTASLAIAPPQFGVGEYLAPESAAAADSPGREGAVADAQTHSRGGGMGRRRVLVHPSGYEQSPYADVRPAGTGPAEAPRKLWHSSPGSSGR